jgi:hypothetical protein
MRQGFRKAMEKVSAFIAGEAEEKIPGDAERLEAAAVVMPHDAGGDKVNESKLIVPEGRPSGRQVGEAFAEEVMMKGDVPDFVAKDFLTDILDERIAGVPREEGVVHFGDEFGGEKNLNIELEIDDGAEAAEDGVGPLFLETGSFEVMDEVLEKAGMFVFLLDEELDGALVFGVSIRISDGGGEAIEASAATGFAELENGNGIGEGLAVGGVGNATGLAPVGVLVASLAGGEVVDPVVNVHGCFRARPSR